MPVSVLLDCRWMVLVVACLSDTYGLLGISFCGAVDFVMTLQYEVHAAPWLCFSPTIKNLLVSHDGCLKVGSTLVRARQAQAWWM